jgi:hypothetical protein
VASLCKAAGITEVSKITAFEDNVPSMEEEMKLAKKTAPSTSTSTTSKNRITIQTYRSPRVTWKIFQFVKDN